MSNDDKFCPSCFEKYGEELDQCPACKIRLVAALDKDLTGKVLDDRYEVISVLGKGGMGVVYRAKQKIIDRPVALKVLRRELIQDQSSVKRFLVEAKASSTLRSPHTITLFDFGITQEGLLYFTMELLDGMVPTKAIQQESPFSPERAGRNILQACESLKEAHAAGILHRDLKPDNIFLIPGPDGKEHVKVLDFGIAKILDDGTSESITKTGMVCGTPMYLSPEQAVGRTLDARSDAYSLGIILYEMLSGEPPFVDTTPVGVLMKQISEAPIPISRRKPEVKIPATVERFLMRILAKDPNDRPADITAMAAELTAALEGKDEEKVRMPGLMATHAGVQIPTAEFYAQKEGPEVTAPLMQDVSGSSRRTPVSRDAVTSPSNVESIAPGKSKRGLYIALAMAAALAVCVVVLMVAFPNGGGEVAEKSAGNAPGETSADVVEPEEARPAGVAAESAAAEVALAADQEAAMKARAEADRRGAELADREKLLREKEEQLAKAVELVDREKALAEREKAALDAEAAAKAVAIAEAEAAATAKAEEEAAELAAAKAEAEAEAEAAQKSKQVADSGSAEAARKRAEEARKRAEKAKADRRAADEQKRAAERARKAAETERKKAEADKKKAEKKDDEPDFEDI